MNSPKNVSRLSSSSSSKLSCSFDESECVGGVTVGGGRGNGVTKVGAAAVVSASHLHQQHHRPYHLHNHQVNHNHPTLNSRTSSSTQQSSLSHMSHVPTAHDRAAQCVHGVLVRTISTTGNNFSCPVHGTQAHLCSSEAKVMSRANKILMYVHGFKVMGYRLRSG